MVVVVVVGMPRAAAVMSAHRCFARGEARVRNMKNEDGDKEWTIDMARCRRDQKISKVPWEEVGYILFHLFIDSYIVLYCSGWVWVIIMSRTNESDAWVREGRKGWLIMAGVW